MNGFNEQKPTKKPDITTNAQLASTTRRGKKKRKSISKIMKESSKTPKMFNKNDTKAKRSSEAKPKKQLSKDASPFEPAPITSKASIINLNELIHLSNEKDKSTGKFSKKGLLNDSAKAGSTIYIRSPPLPIENRDVTREVDSEIASMVETDGNDVKVKLSPHRGNDNFYLSEVSSIMQKAELDQFTEQGQTLVNNNSENYKSAKFVAQTNKEQNNKT